VVFTIYIAKCSSNVKDLHDNIYYSKEICIRSLSSDERNHSNSAPQISDIREYISRIDQIKFQHVKRSQNTAAHELSQHSRRVNSSAVWLRAILECIVQSVCRDCNSIMT
jgi:hypothetical protein